jgi:L-ascorbate metabolism protein UlaG (beta-lactamase superfamily)
VNGSFERGSTAIGAPSTALSLTWLGHATVLLDLDGVTAITDPILRNRVAHLRRVAAPVTAPQDVALALISHAHRDHLDVPSLRRLPPSATVVAPRGLERTLGRLGFEDVRGVVAGDRLDVAGTTVEATEADHAPGRGIGKGGPEAVGYLVGNRATVYFAGDTGLTPALGALRGRVDVALLPVSGWGPRLPAGHLTPVAAAQLLQMIAPRVAVPVHWGTLRPLYRLRPYPSDEEAPHRFAQLAAGLAPEVDVRILQPGESFTLQ